MSRLIQLFFLMATSFHSKIDRIDEHTVRRNKVATFQSSYAEKGKDNFEAMDIFSNENLTFRRK